MTAFTRYPYTGPADQITAITVEAPWTATRRTQTIEHRLLESSRTLFTLRPPEPRRGLIVLRFETAEEAHLAADFFSSPAEYDMYPVSPPELSARFVITGGDITVAQDVGSWTVTLPWVEVIT